MTTVERLMEGVETPLADIEAGRGDWFDDLAEPITAAWGTLPIEAKVIAYLWAVDPVDGWDGEDPFDDWPDE